MAVNKVVYGGNTLVDLSGDTVTPETLLAGIIAHDKSGAVITGLMEAGGNSAENSILNFFGGSKCYTGIVTPSKSSNTLTFTPSDPTILTTLKLLLIVPVENTTVLNTRGVLRLPEPTEFNPLSIRLALSIGDIKAVVSGCMDSDGFTSHYYCVSGKKVSTYGTFTPFADNYGVTIDNGSINVDTQLAAAAFISGQPYGILLVG